MLAFGLNPPAMTPVMMRIQKVRPPIATLLSAATIAILAAVALDTANAAGANFCETYAREAVRQSDICQNSNCPCRGKPWSQDYTVHYNWCRNARADLARQVNAIRRRQLARCGRPSQPKRTEKRRGEWYAWSRMRSLDGRLCPDSYPVRRGTYCYKPCRRGFVGGISENRPVCYRCPQGYTRAQLGPNGSLVCYK